MTTEAGLVAAASQNSRAGEANSDATTGTFSYAVDVSSNAMTTEAGLDASASQKSRADEDGYFAAADDFSGGVLEDEDSMGGGGSHGNSAALLQLGVLAGTNEKGPKTPDDWLETFNTQITDKQKFIERAKLVSAKSQVSPKQQLTNDESFVLRYSLMTEAKLDFQKTKDYPKWFINENNKFEQSLKVLSKENPKAAGIIVCFCKQNTPRYNALIKPLMSKVGKTIQVDTLISKVGKKYHRGGRKTICTDFVKAMYEQVKELGHHDDTKSTESASAPAPAAPSGDPTEASSSSSPASQVHSPMFTPEQKTEIIEALQNVPESSKSLAESFYIQLTSEWKFGGLMDILLKHEGAAKEKALQRAYVLYCTSGFDGAHQIATWFSNWMKSEPDPASKKTFMLKVFAATVNRQTCKDIFRDVTRLSPLPEQSLQRMDELLKKVTYQTKPEGVVHALFRDKKWTAARVLQDKLSLQMFLWINDINLGINDSVDRGPNSIYYILNCAQHLSKDIQDQKWFDNELLIELMGELHLDMDLGRIDVCTECTDLFSSSTHSTVPEASLQEKFDDVVSALEQVPGGMDRDVSLQWATALAGYDEFAIKIAELSGQEQVQSRSAGLHSVQSTSVARVLFCAVLNNPRRAFDWWWDQTKTKKANRDLIRNVIDELTGNVIDGFQCKSILPVIFSSLPKRPSSSATGLGWPTISAVSKSLGPAPADTGGSGQKTFGELLHHFNIETMQEPEFREHFKSFKGMPPLSTKQSQETPLSKDEEFVFKYILMKYKKLKPVQTYPLVDAFTKKQAFTQMMNTFVKAYDKKQ